MTALSHYNNRLEASRAQAPGFDIRTGKVSGGPANTRMASTLCQVKRALAALAVGA